MFAAKRLRYTERNASIPRRKSCTACAKAKRRCDLALPICSRCNLRQINCLYPVLTQSIPSSSIPSAPDLDPLYNLTSPPVTLQQHSDGTHISRVNDFTLTSGPTFPILPPATVSRVMFAFKQLQDAPRSIVFENQTAWCHPGLYQNEIPRSMQDAISVCALHLARNAANSATVSSIIESRIAELVASEQTGTPLECLARVHALILYQTIRLFDDDISCRLAAEEAMPSFHAAVLALLPHAQFEDTLSLSNVATRFLSSSRQDFWQTWVLEESVRRTMLLSKFLTRIWELLRGDQGIYCDYALGFPPCWYVSTSLWEAKSPYEFAVAYAEKRRFLIRDMDFTDLLAYGQPDDVDMFGKIMLIGKLGLDTTQAWFASHGAVL